MKNLHLQVITINGPAYCLSIVSSNAALNFKRRIKSRLPFADIISRLSYSTRFQDKG